MKGNCAWGIGQMEVATYAANIAPPVFSPSVEGAKRDNLARQTIPQPVESQNSAASEQAASQATSGTNSTLYAQSQVVITEDGRRNKQQGGGKGSSKGNGGSEGAEGKSTAQTAQSQAMQSASRISQGQGTAAENSAKSVAASYSGSAQSAREEKEIRKSGGLHPSYARYSTEAAHDGQDSLASKAVSARYNGIVRTYTPGQNLSLMA